MNRWAREGGNPFADATWDEAWKVSSVNPAQWDEIQRGLREETHRWLQMLAAPRDITDVELTGVIASIGHLAYHLGAIRQIQKSARGPREGTFTWLGSGASSLRRDGQRLAEQIDDRTSIPAAYRPSLCPGASYARRRPSSCRGLWP